MFDRYKPYWDLYVHYCMGIYTVGIPLLFWFVIFKICFYWYCVFTPKGVEYLEDIPILCGISDRLCRLTTDGVSYSLASFMLKSRCKR